MSSDEIKILNNLIQQCEDAQEFYEEACETTDNHEMRMLFARMKEARAPIIADLIERVKALGGEAKDAETVMGEIRASWGKLKATLSTNKDETLVSELEEVEDRSLEEFYSAVAKNLPEQTIIMLKRHANALRKTHDIMKATQDMFKDAA